MDAPITFALAEYARNTQPRYNTYQQEGTHSDSGDLAC